MGLWELLYNIACCRKHNPLLAGLAVNELNGKISELQVQRQGDCGLSEDQEQELRDCILKQYLLREEIRRAIV